MKFLVLKVEHFRCVRQAELHFSEGLNVLYGPNDLGKSSLAEAIRAVLLLQQTSTHAAEFLPWDGGGAPQVELTFETEAQRIWRVRKTFGELPSAFLEESRNGLDFQLAARGRDVQGRVSELLQWGVGSPGGRSRPRGMPSSFLSTALLADQDRVAAIFDQELSEDLDESGKRWLTEALEAMAEDPVFKAVLQRVQDKVDEAFSATGRRRTGKNSPWVQIRAQLKAAQEYQNHCAEESNKTKAIELEIHELREQQVEKQEKLEQAKQILQQIEESHQQTEKRHEISARLSAKVAELNHVNESFQALENAQTELVTCSAQIEDCREALKAAEDRLNKAKEEESAQQEKLRRLESGDHAKEVLLQKGNFEKRKAELDRDLAETNSKLEHLESIKQSHDGLESLGAEVDELATAVDQLKGRERELLKTSDTLKRQEEELLAVKSFIRWQSAKREFEEAEQGLKQLSELREEAQQKRDEAQQILINDSAVSLPSTEKLAALERLHQELQLASAGLDVGLSVDIKPKRRLSVAVSSDGAESVRQELEESPVKISAARTLELDIEDVAEIQVLGGSEDVRKRVEELEGRWQSQSETVFRAAGVNSLEELQRAVHAANTNSEKVKELNQAAGQLDQRIADLPDWQARIAERRQDLTQAESDLEDQDRSALQSLARESGLGTETDVEDRLTPLGEERSRCSEESRQVERELAGQETALTEHRKRFREAKEGLDKATDKFDRPWQQLLPELEAVRENAESEIKRIDEQLMAIATEEDSALPESREALNAAEQSRAEAERLHKEAGQKLQGAELKQATLRGEIEQRLEATAKLDREAASKQVQDIQAELDAVPEPAQEISDELLERAKGMVEAASTELEGVEENIQAKRGALEQVGGSVAKEREELAEEELTRAQEQEHEMEVDYEAWQLLRDTLREAEQDEGGHLGRALAEPIAARFGNLTKGRYGAFALGPGLGTEGLGAAGDIRHVSSLSVGTREQLSTVFRLALAEELGTALVLDDQLTQSDTERMGWLGNYIREVAGKIQVIVLTCRPDEYLSANEEEAGAGAETHVSSQDLLNVIERS